MEIVIIGASFAGLSAAIECRKLYEHATIRLIDKEENVAYFPNALNWMLHGKIADWNEARIELLEQVLQLDIICQFSTECISIFPEDKSILLNSDGTRIRKSFDKLILAMGASQSWDWSNNRIEKYFIRTKSHKQLQDSLQLLSNANSVAVIGAGQIGMESLDALSQLNLTLHLFEAQDSILAKYMDSDMLDVIYEALDSRGVVLHLSETVNSIEITTQQNSLNICTIKGEYIFDLVLPATNFRPNTELAKSVFALFPDGTIRIDDYLETNHKDIFAAGDLISLPVEYFGRAYYPMIQHAIMTGRIAAQNVIEKKIPLNNAQRIVSTQIFDYYVSSIGLTKNEADLWLDCQSIRIRKKFTQWDDQREDFKLIVEKGSGRLLGGQLVSTGNHIEQMNTLSLAISQGLTVYDLVSQSWLCLPGKTPSLPLMVEAAQEFIRQGEHVTEVDDAN